MGSLPILDIKSINEYIPENDQWIMFENENNTCINNLFAMGTFDDIILNIGKYLKYNQLHYIDLDTLNSNLNIDVKKNDVLVFNHDLNNNITKIYKSIEPVQKLTENMAFFKKDLSSVLFVDKNFNNRTLFVENYNNDLVKININIEKDNINDISLSKKKNKTEFDLNDKKQKKSKKIKDKKSEKKNKDDFDTIKISKERKEKTNKVVIDLNDKKKKKEKSIKKQKNENEDEFDKLKISKIKKEKKSVNDSKINKDKPSIKTIKKFDLNDKQKNIYENNDNNNLNAKLLTNYKNVKNNKMSSYILEKNIDDEGNCEILFENDNIDIDLEEIKDCNLINLKFKNEQNKEDVANATVDVKSILNNSKNSKRINVSAKEMEEVKPLQDKNTSSNNDNVMTFFIILIIVVILGLLFYFFYYKKRNASPGDGFQLV